MQDSSQIVRNYLIALTGGYSEEPIAAFGFIPATDAKAALANFEAGLGDTPHVRVFRAFRKNYRAIEVNKS